MNKIEPFSSLDENLADLPLSDKVREFLQLIKEDRIKEDNNECTILKCPSCEGLLVQIPEELPLKVKCMNCKDIFLLKDLMLLEK